MEMVQVAGTQTLVMFLLMAVGFLCQKKKLITDAGSQQMNKLLFTAIVPCIMVDSYNQAFDPALFRQLLQGFGLAALSMGVGLAVCLIAVRGKSESRRIERFGVLCPNCGFMGIPLVSAVLGGNGVIFASAYLTVMTLYQWTVGILVLTGKTDAKTALKKLLLNPATISLAIGLVIFCGNIHLPGPISTTVHYLAKVNTPLAMLVVGAFAAQTDLKAAFRNRRIYWASFLRLAVIPLLSLPLCMLVGGSEELLLSNFLSTACPIAAVTSLFPALFGMDREYGAGMVTVSTVLSVGSIPLLVLLRSVLL